MIATAAGEFIQFRLLGAVVFKTMVISRFLLETADNFQVTVGGHVISAGFADFLARESDPLLGLRFRGALTAVVSQQVGRLRGMECFLATVEERLFKRAQTKADAPQVFFGH
jgi:hypothetical protein